MPRNAVCFEINVRPNTQEAGFLGRFQIARRAIWSCQRAMARWRGWSSKRNDDRWGRAPNSLVGRAQRGCPASVPQHPAAGLATQKVGKARAHAFNMPLRCRTYGARISSVYCFYKDIAATRLLYNTTALRFRNDIFKMITTDDCHFSTPI